MQRKRVDSIRTLKSLRDTYQSQLDISIVAELNAVIVELEEVDNHMNEKRKWDSSLRALQICGIVISLVSNIKDMIK